MVPNRVSMRLGFWASSFVAVLSVVYLVTLVGYFATAGFALPPTPFVQIVSGLVTILSAPALLVVFAVIADLGPKEKAAYGTTGLSFAILFVAMVSINRFVQLTIVRLSPPAALTADLARFVPYSAGSVMTALEILGWGFFFSIACLFVAPLFSGPALQRSIRWLFVLFALFSFTSVVGFATATPVGSAAFVAWGPINLALSILLAILFRRGGLPSPQ
ncbi:hypothetical protein ACFLWA_09285 [Chloroflexota bacterium]